ncbi:hypothetical protein NDU88_008250 [Pleurodeles waltl]|uniref:Uncharacterized protein n=1 Tax=Pleurodeles waltl TaxID=8319 RepID=A0AAV7N6N7_PLEWA|nr:hypothetical protein NDU88_008250 [Pleurodeles waltl]
MESMEARGQLLCAGHKYTRRGEGEREPSWQPHCSEEGRAWVCRDPDVPAPLLELTLALGEQGRQAERRRQVRLQGPLCVTAVTAASNADGQSSLLEEAHSVTGRDPRGDRKNPGGREDCKVPSVSQL